jgi:hypothetical protein
MQPFFPFKTCEEPSENGLVAQPVSATINIITCIILMYFMLQARTTAVRILFLSFITFQAFHAFSHIQHIDGSIQVNVIHVIWYMLSFTALYTIITLSKISPSIYIIAMLCALIIIDLYIWNFIGGVYMIFSGFAILLSIVISYYNSYPTFIKNALIYMIIGLCILLAFIVNEKLNCENMIAYANLPYHAIIETLGLILFIALAYLFVRWEQTK